MNILQKSIIEIYKEEHLKRVVIVDLLIDSYGGKEKTKVVFLIRDWSRIKNNKSYWENETLFDTIGVDYFENLSDHEWYERFHKVELKDFTDEELVKEFNKRLKNKLFHNITFEGEAKLTK